MVAPAVQGIDLFKIAGRSISGWIPSLKTGTPPPVRQPFCSQLEERLLMWLEYHPQVSRSVRGDIGVQFTKAYRLPTPDPAPFAIGYEFLGKPHEYLPDVIATLNMVVADPGAGTLSPHGGVLRFKSHKKRKTHMPNTGRRWARGKGETDWDVVGGERK